MQANQNLACAHPMLTQNQNLFNEDILNKEVLDIFFLHLIGIVDSRYNRIVEYWVWKRVLSREG